MNKILVATDGSVQAQKAIDFACDLAWKHNAAVYIAHVAFKTKVPEYVVEFVKTERVEGSPERVYMDALGKDIIERAEDQVRGKGLHNFQSVIMQGEPSEEIIRFAKDHEIDTIVMGNRGLGGMQRLLQGSVSQKVCSGGNYTCLRVK